MSEKHGDRPVAFVQQAITLKDGVVSDDFEKFVLEDVFPSLDTSGDEEGADQHFLLAGSVPNEYVWLSRLEYWIHQTPLPQWLFNRVKRLQQETPEKFETFATRMPPQVHYDVTGWRRRLGK